MCARVCLCVMTRTNLFKSRDNTEESRALVFLRLYHCLYLLYLLCVCVCVCVCACLCVCVL